MPLSAVSAGNVFYDVADYKMPHLLQNEMGNWQAPAFCVDWKGATWAKAESQVGAAHPARELRVRTAIDSENRTGEKGDSNSGGSLFAWELIHPWLDKTDGEPEPIVWKGRIELTAVADLNKRRETAKQIASIFCQLGFLSKTKAACKNTMIPAESLQAQKMKKGDNLALVLRTPALLADPRFQNVENVTAKHGSLNATELWKLYNAIWNELSGNSLSLSHYFARQFLAGGNYLALRYQIKGKARKSYDPWLLTSAGSVFVFKIFDETKAQSILGNWFNKGLPLPDWARKEYGDTWEKNPYIPNNGFGEIALHQPFFASLKIQPVPCDDPIHILP
jgi:hypothetical protein